MSLNFRIQLKNITLLHDISHLYSSHVYTYTLQQYCDYI